MKIFVDADGSPVVDISIELAKKYELEIVVVKNYAVQIEDTYAEIVSVDISQDSADFYIVNHLNSQDIVVTQDYGLAAMCLAKGGRPINQNGFIFEEDNIDHMLNRRHIHREIRRAGGRHNNPKKRKTSEDKIFREKLEWLINS